MSRRKDPTITKDQSLLAGDVVKLSTGECFFYAGCIPAQGHFVKDAHGNTHLVPKQEVPVLVQRQQPTEKKTFLVYHKSNFPHDDSYAS